MQHRKTSHLSQGGRQVHQSLGLQVRVCWSRKAVGPDAATGRLPSLGTTLPGQDPPPIRLEGRSLHPAVRDERSMRCIPIHECSVREAPPSKDRGNSIVSSLLDESLWCKRKMSCPSPAPLRRDNSISGDLGSLGWPHINDSSH